MINALTNVFFSKQTKQYLYHRQYFIDTKGRRRISIRIPTSHLQFPSTRDKVRLSPAHHLGADYPTTGTDISMFEIRAISVARSCFISYIFQQPNNRLTHPKVVYRIPSFQHSKPIFIFLHLHLSANRGFIILTGLLLRLRCFPNKLS